jgi:hypothetical protein
MSAASDVVLVAYNVTAPIKVNFAHQDIRTILRQLWGATVLAPVQYQHNKLKIKL